MMKRPGAHAALAITGTLTLSGCLGALFGGGKPAVLYRFGSTPTIASSHPIATPRRILALRPPQFVPATGGDRILTSQDNVTSYVKEMRWVSAAPTLYGAALESTFADRAPDIAVADRTVARRADAAMSVAINRFEATYPAGAGKTVGPVIHIDGQAILVEPATQRIIGRYTISVTQPASANTASAIAVAFDAAANRSNVQLVDWTIATMPVPIPH